MYIELNSGEISSYKESISNIQNTVLDVIMEECETEEEKQPLYQFLAKLSIIYEYVDYGEMEEENLRLIDEFIEEYDDINFDNLVYFNIKNIYFEDMDNDDFLRKILKGE